MDFKVTYRSLCVCMPPRAGESGATKLFVSCSATLFCLSSSSSGLLDRQFVRTEVNTLRRDYDYVTIICNNPLRIYRPKPKQTCMCSVLELEGRLLGEGGQYWLAWSLCNANAASQFHRSNPIRPACRLQAPARCSIHISIHLHVLQGKPPLA